MSARVHRLLSVILFNAKGILGQRYELSNRCKTYIETHLKPHERFFFKTITFTRLNASQEEKALPITT
jgi:hypothetical protein